VNSVVFATVLVTEAEQTKRVITALIIALLVVAALLALLTLWYWRHTNPRRYARHMFPEPRGADLDLRRRYNQDPRAVGGDQRHDIPDPYAGDPRYQGERYPDPRNVDPRSAGPRSAGPRSADPRSADQRYSDGRYQDGPFPQGQGRDARQRHLT
jgi:hypothetical protein